MKDKFGIVCCENVRKEVDLVLSSGKFPDVITRSYTSHCLVPPIGENTVAQAYDQIRDDCDQVCILGCGCSFNLEIPVMAEDIVIWKGADLFLPPAQIEHYYRNQAYIVTPGWLARWPQRIACQGLSQDTARQMFGEVIREVILVDTGTEPGIEAILQDFSQFLNIPATRLPVGLDYFRLMVKSRYYAWCIGQERAKSDAAIGKANQKSADYAMVFDLLGTIAGLQSEEALIRQILELYTLLFSPGKVAFIPAKRVESHTATGKPDGSPDFVDGIPVPQNFTGEYELTPSGDGFFHAVRYNDQRMGVIAALQVVFPDHMDDYLNISHFVVRVSGLALSNAQVYQKLKETVQERDMEITERRKAEDAAKAANRKLNLLSSITRHDINNQLTVLSGYLELLQDSEPDPALIEYCGKAATAADRISAMIRFTKTYESIGINAPAWQDIRSLVSAAANDVALGKIQIVNDIPSGSEVFADPLIIKVFYNLMDNAVRYGGKITTIRFSVQRSGSDYLIICEDDGDGVAAEEKEKIFVRGFGKNTGLGLFLSREILSITGLTIMELGEPGQGARFEITTPEGNIHGPDLQ